MFINNLPYAVLYNICKYLSFIDIINLSKTSKELYILIDNDDYFWKILIKNHFGSKLHQRYVNEIFQNKKNSDFVLYRTDKDKEKFEKSYRKYQWIHVCNMWLLNVLNGKDNSDGYVAYKSIVKQKLRPRANELTMSLTVDEFFKYYLNRNKNLTKENILQISLYKLIYYYLIEYKRLLGVDLFGINLSCTPNHLRCFNKIYPYREYDLNCLTGQCIRLHSTRSLYLAGIKGKFQSILPGIYEIICRIKLDKNDEDLKYYTEHCSQDESVEKYVECYFYALADHGLDCECNRKTMNFHWFESNYLLHGNINWFNQTMGQIIVLELSDIYFGFENRYKYSYWNILFDYIQLNIVE